MDGPIAELAVRALGLEREVLERTESLAVPGARGLAELAELAREGHMQREALASANDALVSALWQELRRDPLPTSPDRQPMR